jgi:hypothetical protein
MYIVGQERRLVNPPSQVVAGVRTVTTNMDGRDALPRMSRPFAFLGFFNSACQSSNQISNRLLRVRIRVVLFLQSADEAQDFYFKCGIWRFP